MDKIFVLSVHEGEYSDYGVETLAVCSNLNIAKIIAQQNQSEYIKQLRFEYKNNTEYLNKLLEKTPITLEFVDSNSKYYIFTAQSNDKRYTDHRFYTVAEFELNKVRVIEESE